MCSQYPFIHLTQGEYRNDLIHLWHEKLTEFGVPHGKSTSLIATLGDPVKIRSWQIAGTMYMYMAMYSNCTTFINNCTQFTVYTLLVYITKSYY